MSAVTIDILIFKIVFKTTRLAEVLFSHITCVKFSYTNFVQNLFVLINIYQHVQQTCAQKSAGLLVNCPSSLPDYNQN